LAQKDGFFAEKREFRRELTGTESVENKLFRRMQYFYRRELGTYLSHFSKKWASPAVDSQKRKGEIHEKKEQISASLQALSAGYNQGSVLQNLQYQQENRCPFARQRIGPLHQQREENTEV
jgi:hypothetical protein